MPRILPLETLPEIVQIAAPPLNEDAEEAVERKRQFIAERPALWDGPIWWVAEASLREITVFEASYAWVLAARELAELQPGLGYGNLSVELVLRRGANALWQRRALHLADGGGSWTYSASGVLAPGDDPLAQMLAEIEEELHLPAAAIERLRPFALSIATRFTALFFTAELADGFAPGRSDEVEALVWAPTPDALAPSFDALQETWRTLAPFVANE